MSMSEKQQGRSRGLSQPAVPLTRGGSFSDSTNKGGGALSHSLSQITSFMSTSFPSRGKRDDKSPRTADVATLKEEFERKIAAVVFCLEEKAEENIDLSYKIKALQETSKQREVEKDRAIEELQRSLKSKEDEYLQLEKKANDEVLHELNRRIQTITHCLNDMAEENLKLRTQVNANANASRASANGKQVKEDSPSPPSVIKNKPKRRSKLTAKELSFDNQSEHPAPNGIIKTGSFPLSVSPFSAPPANASSFSTETDVPSSSAAFLSSLAASSSILSSKQGQTPTQSTSTSATAIVAHKAANTKTPATSSISTSTSPAPTTAPPPTTSPMARATANAVADMKSEIIAEEFLKDPDWLRKFSETYLVPPPHSQSLALLSDIIKQDKSRLETRVKLSLDDRIKELETQLTEHETKVMGLKAKLEKETDRTGSLSDSVSDYEKKLKELEGRMWDNLNKEAQRRTEAESKAKRLKKKVDELQFLLDELKDDGSDEEEEDDDEEQSHNNGNEPTTHAQEQEESK